MATACVKVLTVFGGLQQLTSVVQVCSQAPSIRLVQVGQLLDQPALVIVMLACRCPQAAASRRGTLGIAMAMGEKGPPGAWAPEAAASHDWGPCPLLHFVCWGQRWHGVLED